MSVWSHPGKDITGMVARADKVAGTIEEVMEDCNDTLTSLLSLSDS